MSAKNTGRRAFASVVAGLNLAGVFLGVVSCFLSPPDMSLAIAVSLILLFNVVMITHKHFLKRWLTLPVWMLPSNLLLNFALLAFSVYMIIDFARTGDPSMIFIFSIVCTLTIVVPILTLIALDARSILTAEVPIPRFLAVLVICVTLVDIILEEFHREIRGIVFGRPGGGGWLSLYDAARQMHMMENLLNLFLVLTVLLWVALFAVYIGRFYSANRKQR